MGCFADPPPATSSTTTSASAGANGPQGCTVASGAPVFAPGGYYTNGSQVCTAQGQPHVFQGVDRPSLEWSSAGENITPGDFAAMADWHANVVRIALNQDFWLSAAALSDGNYPYAVDQAVGFAEAAGLDVILDLHWSDQGNLAASQLGGANDTAGSSTQQPMADTNSVTFWSQVADKYKGDGHVMFELYNEPNGISWDIWLNGGTTHGYQAVGMQMLYDTVRATGAQNLVIAGGNSWAFDLSGVASHRINGYNVLYASHPYKSNDSPGQWPSSFGYLATQNIAPVIVTEFGDNRANVCTGDWDQSLIAYAAPLQISWTAWAWYPGNPCTFPALITAWDTHGSTVQGAAVQAALASNPKPVTWIEAGAPDAADSDAASDATTSDGAGDASVVDLSDADAGTADASLDDASFEDTGTSDAGTD
jgi:endoglucanase